MSSQIPDFSKLSISQRMASPRANAGPRSPGSDSDQSETSMNGIAIGLDHCRQVVPETGRDWFAFQIGYAEVKLAGVRITREGNPTCSCNENPCGHVSWILNHLNTLDAQEEDPYEKIHALGLSKVCASFNWEAREGGEMIFEDAEWDLKKVESPEKISRQIQASTGGRSTRARVIRDILATMSPFVLEEYRTDIFEPDSGNITIQSYPSQDLPATLFSLLMEDDYIFNRFSNLLPLNERTSQFFRKLSAKAVQSCKNLDAYISHGPSVNHHHDLDWCSKELSSIVDSIGTNIRSSYRTPLSRTAKEAAADALVSILELVIHRNVDSYAVIGWNRKKPYGEKEADRNLYIRLIGSSAQQDEGSFVLDVLDDLVDVRGGIIERLEVILDMIKTVGWATPKPYVNRLADLIMRMKRISQSSQRSSSRGKRPAGTLDREAKRSK